MMETSQSVPELVATAQANVKTHEDQIAEILRLMDGQTGSDDQLKELHTATSAIEFLSVDIFAAFEARMQHHFKRGPFSRKLKALLTGAGQPDLAHRIYQYYLAINVLKHGIGVSHRELLETPNSLFIVKRANEIDAPSSLIDVTTPGFFDGLSSTILESYHFLER
jgi:hypothetical protein